MQAVVVDNTSKIQAAQLLSNYCIQVSIPDASIPKVYMLCRYALKQKRQNDK
jgi:hypothetical protein